MRLWPLPSVVLRKEQCVIALVYAHLKVPTLLGIVSTFAGGSSSHT